MFKSSKYKVEYSCEAATETFIRLKPVIYCDGVCYCCISGPNVVEGIFGFGNTPEEAVEDWENVYKRKTN